MLPARLEIERRERRERIDHAHREKLGEPSKRSSCCARRPAVYPEGATVDDIPELADLLRKTSSLMFGYIPYYCCLACGQEWFQDWEQQKFGGLVHLRKARLADAMRGEEEIWDAFREASRARPENITWGPEDDERRAITHSLGRHSASEVPAELLASAPIRKMFPVLSSAAIRYYMPRFIEYCLKEEGEPLFESLIQALANAQADRIAVFHPQERRLVQEFIEYRSELPGAERYAAWFQEARVRWATSRVASTEEPS